MDVDVDVDMDMDIDMDTDMDIISAEGEGLLREVFWSMWTLATGGLIYAYVNMHEAVRLWSRDVLMKFGERVLEVQPLVAGAGGRR